MQDAVYRNCHTGHKVLQVNGVSPQGSCGSCTMYETGDQDTSQCDYVPKQTLTPTRNTQVGLTMVPQDLFGTPTK